MIHHNREADDFSVENIHNRGQIDSSAFEVKVSEIGYPDLIGTGRKYIKQQIGEYNRCISGLFPRLFASSAVGLDAEELHYSQDLSLTHSKVIGHTLVAITGFEVERFFNLDFELPILGWQ